MLQLIYHAQIIRRKHKNEKPFSEINRASDVSTMPDTRTIIRFFSWLII